MLSGLTQRLVENEVKEYEINTLIEGTILGSEINSLKRYSLCECGSNECGSNECGDSDALSEFEQKLAGVYFADDMDVLDRKNALYNTVKGNECSYC